MQPLPDVPNSQDGSAWPRRVLLATDGSEAAREAEDMLARLGPAPGWAVTVITVRDAPEWKVPMSLEGAEREWARRTAEAAEQRLKLPDVEWSHATPRGPIAPEIVRAAEAFHADVILVGSAGHTALERFLLGSVAEAVARRARQPVLVARRVPRDLRQIVVALDGSSHSETALSLVSRLNLPDTAEIHLCHAVRQFYPAYGPEYLPQSERLWVETRAAQREEGERLLEDAGDRLFASGKRVHRVLREGNPADQILAFASECHADLIVLGARGESPIETMVLGSVADRVLRHAHCSVLLSR